MTNFLTPPTYKAITSLQALTPLQTVSLFPPSSNPNSSLSKLSPIDQFLANSEAINVLYLKSPEPLSKELSALVLLGYMSAVESFCRTLVRRIINIDDHCRALAEGRSVPFGAALHHSKLVLPEALLEDISFAGRRGMDELLRNILGIKSKYPSELERVIEEYAKICELRHCCVHRFGKLGVKNAIKLGLSAHSKALEMQFSPTKQDLQIIADILRTFVKTINNFAFHHILERTAGLGLSKDEKIYYGWNWKGNYGADRHRFLKYYSLFASEADSPPSPPPKNVYDSLMNAVQGARAQ